MTGSHANAPSPTTVRDPRTGLAGAQPAMLTPPRMRSLLLDGLAALGSLVMTATGLSTAR